MYPTPLQYYRAPFTFRDDHVYELTIWNARVDFNTLAWTPEEREGLRAVRRRGEAIMGLPRTPTLEDELCALRDNGLGDRMREGFMPYVESEKYAAKSRFVVGLGVAAVGFVSSNELLFLCGLIPAALTARSSLHHYLNARAVEQALERYFPLPDSLSNRLSVPVRNSQSS